MQGVETDRKRIAADRTFSTPCWGARPKGRLLIDEPTDLAEGTEIELAIAGDADELDEEERARLHSALRRSWASAKAGKTRPAGRVLRKLKGA